MCDSITVFVGPFCFLLSLTIVQKMKFAIKDFFSKCDHIRIQSKCGKIQTRETLKHNKEP